jgi:hypothetical protein
MQSSSEEPLKRNSSGLVQRWLNLAAHFRKEYTDEEADEDRYGDMTLPLCRAHCCFYFQKRSGLKEKTRSPLRRRSMMSCPSTFFMKNFFARACIM